MDTTDWSYLIWVVWKGYFFNWVSECWKCSLALTVIMWLLLCFWCVHAYFCSVEDHSDWRQHGLERAEWFPLLLLCAQPFLENSQVKRNITMRANLILPLLKCSRLAPFGTTILDPTRISSKSKYFTECWGKMRTPGLALWAAEESMSRGFRRMSWGTGPQMGGSPSLGGRI